MLGPSNSAAPQTPQINSYFSQSQQPQAQQQQQQQQSQHSLTFQPQFHTPHPQQFGQERANGSGFGASTLGFQPSISAYGGLMELPQQQQQSSSSGAGVSSIYDLMTSTSTTAITTTAVAAGVAQKSPFPGGPQTAATTPQHPHSYPLSPMSVSPISTYSNNNTTPHRRQSTGLVSTPLAGTASTRSPYVNAQQQQQHQLTAEFPTTVTIFGFPASHSAQVLSQFRNYGTIIGYQHIGNSNWMNVEYETPVQAQVALGKNGQIMGGDMMIGVVPMRALHATGLSEKSLTAILSPMHRQSSSAGRSPAVAATNLATSTNRGAFISSSGSGSNSGSGSGKQSQPVFEVTTSTTNTAPAAFPSPGLAPTAEITGERQSYSQQLLLPNRRVTSSAESFDPFSSSPAQPAGILRKNPSRPPSFHNQLSSSVAGNISAASATPTIKRLNNDGSVRYSLDEVLNGNHHSDVGEINHSSTSSNINSRRSAVVNPTSRNYEEPVGKAGSLIGKVMESVFGWG